VRVGLKFARFGAEISGFGPIALDDVPVSYTHLDVYKRQQLVRVNADVIRPDPSRSFAERAPVICQVRMVNETPLIPDLQRLEEMIAEETSVMP